MDQRATIEALEDLIKDFENLKKYKLYVGSFKAIDDCITLTYAKIEEIKNG
jgi:hypothetical protein